MEWEYDIGFLNVRKKKDEPISMDDKFYKLIQTVFRTTRKKPVNHKELMQLYAMMVRQVAGHTLLTSSQSLKASDRNERLYALDNAVAKFHLTLHKYKDKKLKHFHESLDLSDLIEVGELDNDDDQFDDELDTTALDKGVSILA